MEGKYREFYNSTTYPWDIASCSNLQFQLQVNLILIQWACPAATWLMVCLPRKLSSYDEFRKQAARCTDHSVSTQDPEKGRTPRWYNVDSLP
ncbi:hypothetical protein P3L10_018901 [Capsicum annuum]